LNHLERRILAKTSLSKLQLNMFPLVSGLAIHQCSSSKGEYEMARAPAVEKMTLKQIQDLEARIAAAKAKAAEDAKAEVKAKIDALLANSGFTIGDLYSLSGRGKGRSKSAAKYRNPDDPSQTWTGRGRKPNWLVARLKKGQKMESFAI
jgi:DNA-binding protein H-NS